MYVQTLLLWCSAATAPSPGLHRKRLVQELLVEILLDVVHQDDGFALVVKLGAPRPAHHLQNVCTHTTVGGVKAHSQRGTLLLVRSTVRQSLAFQVTKCYGRGRQPVMG